MGRFEPDALWAWVDGTWARAVEVNGEPVAQDLRAACQALRAEGIPAHVGSLSMGPPDGEPVAGCCFDDDARP